jgi:putative hydrolase of the HAD superfamily
MIKKTGYSHYKYILFDLDETLYPREAGLMQALSARMLQFMTEELGIPPDDVADKRRYYYQKYGTTLRGLMEEHRIDPEGYLAYVHNVRLADFLAASPPLNNMLHEIPLRKAIFTNADAAHAERVLDALQVRFHFERIIDIVSGGFVNKPHPLAYHQALAVLGVDGDQCIMVEDTPRNLMPAKDLGMTTILVDGAGGAGSSCIGIDYTVPTVFHVGQIVKNLLPQEGLH